MEDKALAQPAAHNDEDHNEMEKSFTPLGLYVTITSFNNINNKILSRVLTNLRRSVNMHFLLNLLVLIHIHIHC